MACEERWNEINFFNLVKRRGKAGEQSCNNRLITGRAVTKRRETLFLVVSSNIRRGNTTGFHLGG